MRSDNKTTKGNTIRLAGGMAVFASRGRSEDGGTRDELGGRSESRVEKRLERAQYKTGGKEGSPKEEGADGWEEGRAGAVPP